MDSRYETCKHIFEVQKYLNAFSKELIDRGHRHDQSKLNTPEVEYFDNFTEKLHGITFGSDEYKKCLEEIAPALEHHYAKNSHHPQYYKKGIEDMNLLDLVEMLSDWYAATKRHNDGNIRKSLEYNKHKFNISDQLIKILENTIPFLENS